MLSRGNIFDVLEIKTGRRPESQDKQPSPSIDNLYKKKEENSDNQNYKFQKNYSEQSLQNVLQTQDTNTNEELIADQDLNSCDMMNPCLQNFVVQDKFRSVLSLNTNHLKPKSFAHERMILSEKAQNSEINHQTQFENELVKNTGSEFENISNKSEKFDHKTFNSSQKMSENQFPLMISTFNLESQGLVKKIADDSLFNKIYIPECASSTELVLHKFLDSQNMNQVNIQSFLDDFQKIESPEVKKAFEAQRKNSYLGSVSNSSKN